MKTKLKKQLRKLFVATVSEIDPRFVVDSNFDRDPRLVVVKRSIIPDVWEYIALSFSPLEDRFFIEAAVAPTSSFPVGAMPLGPESPLRGGVLRFRASHLWNHSNKSGGWLIYSSSGVPPENCGFPCEGIFAQPETAIADVMHRIRQFVLPYFEMLEGKYLF